MKNISKILIIGVATLIMSGCMQRVAVEKTRTITTVKMELNKEESSKATQDGITIKVRPIHSDNIDKYPALHSKLNYWYYITYNGKRYDFNKDGYYDTRNGTLDFNLVATPAFEVKITNSTNHVLKFSNAVVAVEDNNGNNYDGLSKSDLKDYLTESIDAHLGDTNTYHLKKGEKRTLFSKIRKLRLVDNNLKILPGKTVKAYAVCNYGNYLPKDNKNFIIDSTKLTLGLYELPSKINEAGGTTKTTNFSFVYDIKVKDKTEKYTAYIWK